MTTTYLGYDVLEAPQNAREDQTDGMSRSVAMFDPGIGKRSGEARDSHPAVQRPYLWTCRSHAEIAEMKAWGLRRKGRAVPFWAPTWRRDLILHADVGAIDTGIAIESMRYSEMLFPAKARRHLAFWTPSRTLIYRAVTASVNNGTTETLTLSASLGVLFPKAGLLSFLVLARLSADEVEIQYHTDSLAEASIPFVEVPQEAP